MGQLSWKLYLDNFPFLGSSLAHLEPKLELFEFWEFGSWWLFVARLYPIYVLFAFKIFLLPVPTRPGTRPFLQVPDPSRPEVKNPYPSDPAHTWYLSFFIPHNLRPRNCSLNSLNFVNKCKYIPPPLMVFSIQHFTQGAFESVVDEAAATG